MITGAAITEASRQHPAPRQHMRQILVQPLGHEIGGSPVLATQNRDELFLAHILLKHRSTCGKPATGVKDGSATEPQHHPPGGDES